MTFFIVQRDRSYESLEIIAAKALEGIEAEHKVVQALAVSSRGRRGPSEPRGSSPLLCLMTDRKTPLEITLGIRRFCSNQSEETDIRKNSLRHENSKKLFRYTLFRWSPLDILLTISGFATTVHVRVLVDC